MASSSSSIDGFDFGQLNVVNPTKEHYATIVWLHDIERTGLDSVKAVRSLGNPNIKWICPTAPVRPVTSLGGRRTTAWFDVYSEVSEDMCDDLGSLNYVNTYVASLLCVEPSHVSKGVGGFGMGATQTLFYATSYAIGKVPIYPKIVIGVNGWLPNLRNLERNMSDYSRSAFRAASLQILITHGMSTDINVATYVQYIFAIKCVDSLRSRGFLLSFKPYGGVSAMNEIRVWLLEYGLPQLKKFAY